jgi:hypothetical protein
MLSHRHSTRHQRFQGRQGCVGAGDAPKPPPKLLWGTKGLGLRARVRLGPAGCSRCLSPGLLADKQRCMRLIALSGSVSHGACSGPCSTGARRVPPA